MTAAKRNLWIRASTNFGRRILLWPPRSVGRRGTATDPRDYNSPAMIRRMSFFDGDKISAASRTNFSSGTQCSLHRRPILAKIDNLGGKKKWPIRRRWPKQLDGVFCGDRARRMVRVGAFHQMISRCPIAMAIQQCSDHAAIQHPRERFVFFLWFPFGHDFAIFRKTANAQPFRVGGTASPAGVFRSVAFLQRFRFVARHRCFSAAPSDEPPWYGRSGGPV